MPKYALLLSSLAVLMLGIADAQPAPSTSAALLQLDAGQMLQEIEANYAYRDRVPEGWQARYSGLRSEIGTIETRGQLLDFMEVALHRLCDHHAITGPSSPRSLAIIPSFSDLWIEADEAGYFVSQVRRDSPASSADLRPGDRLVAVDGTPIEAGIAAFWNGSPPDYEACPSYAARVLAAGGRAAPRRLLIERSGAEIEVELASLYQWSDNRADEPVSLHMLSSNIWQLVFNDRLGDTATIDAIDEIMAAVPQGTRFIIDLRDTPSGGNTVVARAVLGYFTRDIAPYQRHSLPAESLHTGVPRSWIEEVAPRGDVVAEPRQAIVLVGRWTGSMGEGLALGFDALGHEVQGSPMAGLLGAIYDVPLAHTGWIFKLPVERLAHVDGRAREAFVPIARAEVGYAGPEQDDPALQAALAQLQTAH